RPELVAPAGTDERRDIRNLLVAQFLPEGRHAAAPVQDLGDDVLVVAEGRVARQGRPHPAVPLPAVTTRAALLLVDPAPLLLQQLLLPSRVLRYQPQPDAAVVVTPTVADIGCDSRDLLVRDERPESGHALTTVEDL